MLFKSGLVTQVSGSVGGMTGSRNKGGFYLKSRSVPVNPSSPAQTAARLRFQAHSTAWTNTLTQVQRDAWNAWAVTLAWTNSLGDAIQISGQNAFIGANSVLEQAGLAAVTAAPLVASQPTQDIDFSAATNGAPGTVDIDVTSAVNNMWADTTGAAALIYVSRAKSAGTTFFRSPYRLGTVIAGQAGQIFPLLTVFQTPFTYLAGDRVFAQARVVMPDGRYSFMTDLGSQIVA